MSSLDSLLTQVNWDFADLVGDGLHTLHWYPATFIAAIPGSLIPLLVDANGTVLDPFTGSGTTGVEAVRLGRKFVGIDLNPVASKVTTAKLSFVHPRELSTHFNSESLTRARAQRPPAHARERELLRWYDPETYAELLSIVSLLSQIKNTNTRTVAEAAFSSVLKHVSSQSKHWGWVCDNVAPKQGEIRYKPATQAFLRALENYVAASEQMLREMVAVGIANGRVAARKLATVHRGDANQVMSDMPRASVDLILTSPPYLGVTDYIKSQRLTFLWLEQSWSQAVSSQTLDFESLRSMEVGARSRRYRLDSAAAYRAYMENFFAVAERVLRKRGSIAVIVGDSGARESGTSIIIAAANTSGFTIAMDTQRNIRATRRRLMARVPTETILVLRRRK